MGQKEYKLSFYTKYFFKMLNIFYFMSQSPYQGQNQLMILDKDLICYPQVEHDNPPYFDNSQTAHEQI